MVSWYLKPQIYHHKSVALTGEPMVQLSGWTAGITEGVNEITEDEAKGNNCRDDLLQIS